MKLIYMLMFVALGATAVYFFITPSQTSFTNYEDASDAEVRAIDIEGVQYKETVTWPVPGSAPETDVPHSIPLEEIKQGCPRQDCIPSVDRPVFVSPEELQGVLDPESLGIALSYKGVERFYPFPMLETKELVNDIVAGDPLLISYCPLCGTGIVFDRTVDSAAVEFGVSGMLWQSNLLMYNRADELANRNLWSQVLGEAVVGNDVGQKLAVIPSDIMQYGTWVTAYPGGEVLFTGRPQDPYGGEYYRTATFFSPDFIDEGVLEPDAYVYGIEINGVHKAYPLGSLGDGQIQDMIEGVPVVITRNESTVTFTHADGTVIPDIEGFWFSWKSAHPETLIWEE